MLDLCMFAEGSKNEQEISVVGEIGKVKLSLSLALITCSVCTSGSCNPSFEPDNRKFSL